MITRLVKKKEPKKGRWQQLLVAALYDVQNKQSHNESYRWYVGKNKQYINIDHAEQINAATVSHASGIFRLQCENNK